MKTCNKCGFTGEDEFFDKRGYRCKKCHADYNKKQRDDKNAAYNPNEIKMCSECGFIGERKLFVKLGNQCKKCRAAHVKIYSDENKEKLKKQRENRKIMYDPNKIKTCRECGFIGKGDLFPYGQNLCKKCLSESIKRKRKESGTDEIKTCRECGFVGKGNHFVKLTNWCIKCKRRDTKKRYDEAKKQRLERIENNKTVNKVCYVCGFVGSEELFMVKANLCRKCDNERIRKDYAENSELWKTRHNEYIKTPSGKVSKLNSGNKRRRQLGHEPINKWFDGCEGHHLRYSKNIDNQDNNLMIYVPRELHKSIWHNGSTGQGMREINMLLLEWYLENTPREERNPKAFKLYWNYCMLPEPTWAN
jgi:hypothetical protein